MPIRYDARNKRWRYEFDRLIDGRRHRLSRLLPKGWSRAQADAYDLKESARLFAVAAGVERRDPLIDEAVVLYLRDKTQLKSYKATAQHLATIAWAYAGRRLSELPEVARAVVQQADVAPATVRNRLACLKAAARWAWRRHALTDADPTTRMALPAVRNERHVYLTRRQMLQVCRACRNWQAQIAIRLAFYTGLRLGEILRAEPDGTALVVADTKNGDRRMVPAHPRIRHLLRHLPLEVPKITIQAAWMRARDAAGLPHAHFHDLRHSAASEMCNAGVDLYTVGKVLGHRDPRSTARYAHLSPQTLAGAVSSIGRSRA